MLAQVPYYEKDLNPEHWKTINGAKVHLDKNGNYDADADRKFNGSHHYGPDYKAMNAHMNNLANAFRQVVAQKQAQGNGQGNTSAKNVAPKAIQGGVNGGTCCTCQYILDTKMKIMDTK